MPTVELKKLTAPDAQGGDVFGHSVAISGDYAIVGAYHESYGGTEAGAAYVYHRNQGGTDNWGQVRKLTASDAHGGDWFGWSVSVSGDYAIVGAPHDDAGGSDAGAVYVYHRNQGGTDNWGEVKMVTASDAQAGDWFGWSVSVSGDDLAVGAYAEDAGGTNAGAVYVYHKDQGGTDNWGEVKKVTASDPEGLDLFGHSVSIGGDDLIVGADHKSIGGNDSVGVAYVFSRDQGGEDEWGQVTKLTASDGQSYDSFGHSVSVSGDCVIVGSPGAAGDPSPDVGAAYVYYRNQGGTDNWGQVRKLSAPNAQEGDNIGISVSISGDYAVVGAYYEDYGGADAGGAHVYHRNQGGADSWGAVGWLTASDAHVGDNFGISVGISGGRVIVGAGNEESGGTDPGAAYIY